MNMARQAGLEAAVRVMLAAGVLTGLAPKAIAQTSNMAAPVVVGHFHLNVTSIEAHKKFWADTLGGTAMKVHGLDVIRFPDIDVLPAPAEANRSHPRHGVRPHRICRARRAGADHEAGGGGLSDVNGREPEPGQAAAAATGTPAGTAVSRICLGRTVRRWSW